MSQHKRYFAISEKGSEENVNYEKSGKVTLTSLCVLRIKENYKNIQYFSNKKKYDEKHSDSSYPILALAVLYIPLQSLGCKYEEEVFGLPVASCY